MKKESFTAACIEAYACQQANSGASTGSDLTVKDEDRNPQEIFPAMA